MTECFKGQFVLHRTPNFHETPWQWALIIHGVAVIHFSSVYISLGCIFPILYLDCQRNGNGSCIFDLPVSLSQSQTLLPKDNGTDLSCARNILIHKTPNLQASPTDLIFPELLKFIYEYCRRNSCSPPLTAPPSYLPPSSCAFSSETSLPLNFYC